MNNLIILETLNARLPETVCEAISDAVADANPAPVTWGDMLEAANRKRAMDLASTARQSLAPLPDSVPAQVADGLNADAPFSWEEYQTFLKVTGALSSMPSECGELTELLNHVDKTISEHAYDQIEECEYTDAVLTAIGQTKIKIFTITWLSPR